MRKLIKNAFEKEWDNKHTMVYVKECFKYKELAQKLFTAGWEACEEEMAEEKNGAM